MAEMRWNADIQMLSGLTQSAMLKFVSAFGQIDEGG